MIRAYIRYRANRKKLQAVGRLRKLSMKLVRHHENRLISTPMQRWGTVIQKVLYKIRHESNGVDWTEGMNQAKL